MRRVRLLSILLADIFLSHEVNLHLLLQFFLFILLSVAFFFSIYILKNFTYNATTEKQYDLEKKTYLIITIIKFSLIIKIILLPFFTHTIDKLSEIIPGAMCGAGVINANGYGEPLLIFKILILLLIMLWIVLNSKDETSKGYKYFKPKLHFYIFLYIFIVAETIIELLYFSNLSTINPVSCCSVIYDDNENLFSKLSPIEMLISFYLLFFITLIALYFRKRFILIPLTFIFLYISFLSINYLFATYIYQLPTHQCPFCLLKSDYYYIGYTIYASLLLATFYTLSGSIYKFKSEHLSKAIYWYFLYLFLVSISLVVYYVENGTFL